MKRALMVILSGLVVGSIVLDGVSCVQKTDSSIGLKCQSSADCWDNLPCKNELCGGERRPKKETANSDAGTKEATPEPKPEPRPEPRPEPTQPKDKVVQELPATDSSAPDKVADKPTTQCKGNLDAFGQCKEDKDCCPGQKCTEITVPGIGKFKLCGTCKDKVECPETSICCPNNMCAPQCSAP